MNSLNILKSGNRRNHSRIPIAGGRCNLPFIARWAGAPQGISPYQWEARGLLSGSPRSILHRERFILVMYIRDGGLCNMQGSCPFSCFLRFSGGTLCSWYLLCSWYTTRCEGIPGGRRRQTKGGFRWEGEVSTFWRVHFFRNPRDPFPISSFGLFSPDPLPLIRSSRV